MFLKYMFGCMLSGKHVLVYVCVHVYTINIKKHSAVSWVSLA